MATIIGVFQSRDQAERCVREMRQRGFGDSEISILARDPGGGKRSRGRDQEMAGEMGQQDLSDGTAWGGALGAIGGLLAGAGALAIPGVGPIIAAGPLAAALSGAVAGGVAGGLMDLGVPEDRGREYEQELRQGRILAVVEASDDKADEAERIMKEANALLVESHG